MFDEGIYCLTCRAQERGPCNADSSLAVLRNGKILGSDRQGVLFTGFYEYDSVTQLNKMHVRFQVPPNGVLFTGGGAGPGGAIVDIVGAFDWATPTSQALVEVEGAKVELQLTYLGPLPN